jgi:hypothetical protein
VTIAPHDVDLFVISVGSGGRTGERRSMRAGHQGSQCLTIAKAPHRAAAPISAASNVTVNSRRLMAVDSTRQLVVTRVQHAYAKS